MKEIIRVNWIPGILNSPTKPNMSFGEFLSQGRSYRVSKVPSNSIVEIEITNPLEILNPFAFDCNRMSIACLETVLSIQKIDLIPKSTAWLIIQYYYAAYFAAHSLLRTMGVSCSWLETRDLVFMNRLISTTQPIPSKFFTGNYKIKYNSSLKILTLEKLTEKSHESLWKIFHQEMHLALTLAKSVPTIPIRMRDDAEKKLLDLEKILKLENSSSVNWLSTIRNSVNYKHSHSVWFPYKEQPREYARLYEISKKWEADSDSISLWTNDSSRKLQSFVEACSLIIAWNREVAKDINDRSGSESFHKNGFFALLHQSKRNLLNT